MGIGEVIQQIIDGNADDNGGVRSRSGMEKPPDVHRFQRAFSNTVKTDALHCYATAFKRRNGLSQSFGNSMRQRFYRPKAIFKKIMN